MSTRIRAPASLSTTIDTRERRFFGSFGSHSPQSLPIRGTPVEVPDPSTISFTSPALLNSRSKIAGGVLGQRFKRFAAQIRDEARRVGDIGGLARPPAMRHRREERAVGFDQQPVGRDFRREFLQFAARS